MTNEVKIIFSDDVLVTENSAVKNFVENQKAGHCSLIIKDEQYVIVKTDDKKKSLEKVRSTAGNISRDLSSQKVEKASVQGTALEAAFSDLNKEEVAVAFVEGWELGSYQFSTYKSDAETTKTALEVAGDLNASVELGKIRAAATAFSRDLMNELSDVLNPETYPEVLKQQFEGKGVEITVHGKEQLEEMEMNGLLTVCRGSKYNPSFVEIRYEGDSSKPLVALVGKGVTFDTGGISLKSGKDLSSMRMDMGGSAAVAGAMQLLVDSKADVNVVALIPMVENTPDANSVFPGEVIRYKNGKTVQVGNTDAEGRLILADALIRAGELNAEYIVDIATLTGAIVAALGSEIGGVFGDEELSSVMKKVGDQNGDFVWPMPLVEAYDKSLASDYADMNNISSMNFAGSITAGLFLRRFVPENSKWLHVDMAGMMSKSSASGYYAKSATGYGARLLADYTVEVSK
ncbi:leucyl aminopeptidase family protein [Sporosarcina thermotolerans]|uniref:Probable cytosol aminopeptidase n=1 Tax=Sporosarcina thermotolerans TaxID=633404 RepID=A0AAW9A4L7_9BACL|nr:leucyl aminopeptidase family protein [Sporosarcina thermotolerans]MDW0116012.1 leucyl aminopeptidase family protein [Sporosarcina thermotolerans]